MPSLGDAVVDFPWGRKRVLTFALSSGEAEDVNLFDRDRRLQICSYPSSGRGPRYSEDDRRVLDVLEHDITARFDPERLEVLSRAHHAHVGRLSLRPARCACGSHDDFRVELGHSPATAATCSSSACATRARSWSRSGRSPSGRSRSR